jgi:sulfur relay (sulfurtransferase) DsrF/TusC family protein
MTKRVKKTKEQTSKDIWDAIYLIEDGIADKLGQDKPQEMSIKNVCLQANISRPTLYSYPKIKEYIDTNPLKKLKNKDRDKVIVKLEEENQELRDYIEKLEKERDSALLEQFKSNEKNKNNVVSLKKKD